MLLRAGSRRRESLPGAQCALRCATDAPLANAPLQRRATRHSCLRRPDVGGRRGRRARRSRLLWRLRALGLRVGFHLDQRDGAARGLDLRPCRRRDFMRRDAERPIDGAVPQHFEQALRLAWTNQALGGERLPRDRLTGLEEFEIGQVDDDIFLTERILEAAQIGHALREAGLSAFEIRRDLPAGTRLLALLAAARGLDTPRAVPTAHPLALLARARSWA